MSDEQEIRRGRQASVELTETNAIFDRLVNAAIAGWLETSALQTEAREEYYRSVLSLRKVQKELKALVIAGENAAEFKRQQEE